MEHEPIDMIMSDMRMPGMNGYELLLAVKKRYPKIIRVMLSAYAEREIVIKAVADGAARAYLDKPIDNAMLKSRIARLFSTCDRLYNMPLLNVIEKMDVMPVLPPVYDNLVALIRRNCSMEEVAGLITRNPEYAAKILQLANSSFYGTTIGTIIQAVVFLGLETLKNLILSTEIFRSFLTTPSNRQEVVFLLEHANMTNRLFHGLYQRLNRKAVPGEYSCAGLLHDTGFLLMLKYFPSQYQAIMHAQPDDHAISRESAEVSAIGVSHSSLGACLLDLWNLPHGIVETCLYHHDPLNDAVTEPQLCALVHIADAFTWNAMHNVKHPCPIREEVFSRLPTDRMRTEEIMQELMISVG
jgi:HD-like signal output (HDOD) protein